MSKAPRGTNQDRSGVLGSVKTEAEIDVIGRDVELSIKNLTKRFNKGFEQELSTIDSTIQKHIANAEVRLTRNGRSVSNGYKEYLDKINNIHEDLNKAKSKSEVKEINRTIKTYKGIVKNTKNLSKEERKELGNIVKETENASKIVRGSKLGNARLFTQAIKNNLPDIAGLTTAIFGDSLIPAFIGGVIGDYSRTKRDAREQEREKQTQLLKDDRDYNIGQSVEKRQLRDEFMSDKERKVRKYTLKSDSGSLETEEKGFFKRRASVRPAMALKNMSTSILSAMPDSMTNDSMTNDSKPKRLTGSDLQIQAQNTKSLIKRTESPSDGDGPKRGRPLGSKNKIKNNNLESMSPVGGFDASLMEDSVYNGVFNAMMALDKEGLFKEDEKETKFRRNIEKFEQKSKEKKERMDAKDKEGTELEKATHAIIEEQQKNTADLLKLENKRKWISVFETLANTTANSEFLSEQFNKGFDKFALPLIKKIPMPDMLGKFVKEGMGDHILDMFRDQGPVRHKEIVTLMKEADNRNELGRIASENFYQYLMDKTSAGIVTIPFNYGTRSPFELEYMDTLLRIEDFNAQTMQGVGSMTESLSGCLTNPPIQMDGEYQLALPIPQQVEDEKLIRIFDDVKDTLQAQEQKAVEKGIHDKERRSDSIARSDLLQTSVDNIYNLLADGGGLGGAGGAGGAEGGSGIMDLIKNNLFGILTNFKGVMGKGLTFLLRVPALVLTLGSTLMTGFSMLGSSVVGMLSTMGTSLMGLVGSAGTMLAGLGTTLTGGLGLSGLLGASGTAIAGAGAGAMAGAGIAVAGAGAVGYGVGTLINKGIDATIEKMTGGKNDSLGGWLYDLTHPSEISSSNRNKDIQEMSEAVAENKESANINQITNAVEGANVVSGPTTNVSVPVTANDKDQGTNYLMLATLS